MSHSDLEQKKNGFSEYHSYGGDIFKELEIPVDTVAVSRGFCSTGNRIVSAALTTFVLKSGEKLFFEILGSDFEKGPYDKREFLAVLTGPIRFNAGDEIMNFIPDTNSKRFLKLKISDKGDLAPAVITAYLLRKRECRFS